MSLPRLKLAIALVALVCASTAHAAVSYTVTVSRGTLAALDGTFAVVAGDGTISARATRQPEGEVVLYDSLFSGGSGIVAVNSTNSTWYALDPPTPFAVSSSYLNPFPGGAVKNLRMKVEERPAGDDQRYYIVRLTYQVRSSVQGTDVIVFCSAAFEVSTTTRIDRRQWLGRVLGVTGIPAVDAKLAEAEKAIVGMPFRAALVATRQYEGGPEMRDEATVEASDIREGDFAAPPARVPDGYREQKPVVGAPGR